MSAAASRLRGRHDLIYGCNVAAAALAAGHRRIYEACIQLKAGPALASPRLRSPPPSAELANILEKLDAAKIPIKKVFKHELDAISEGRPHNGIALRVSLLKPQYIESFSALNTFNMNKESYSAHVENGDIVSVSRQVFHRPPLWVYLDGITDPHNFGAILRTCHFLGADGVVFSARDMPSLIPAISKASSGALELMVPRIFATLSSKRFLAKCQASDWQIVVADVPMASEKAKNPAPLEFKKPTILVLGSEEDGVSSGVMSLADSYYWLPSIHEAAKSTVDSLNVSVAAGIILDRILRAK